jgi:hypothetical protein
VNCPGPEGQKGDPGDNGNKGDTGAKGDTGSNGETGATGASGIGTNITDAYSMRGITASPWFQFAIDGKEWKDAENSIAFSAPTDIIWNGTIWVAGTISQTSQFAYSNDGKKWNLPSTLQTPFGTKAGAGPRSIVWNGAIWVAVGGPGTSPETGDVSVAYSYDGINWTGIVNSYSTVLLNGYGVAWNGSVFLATGAAASGTNILATSPNGTSWKRVSVSVANTLTEGRCVAWNGNRWLIGGKSSTLTDTKMIFSTNLDGSTGWTTVVWPSGTAPFATECRSVAWNGSMWVAVGGTPTNPNYTTLARSTNGVNWTSVLTNTSSPAFTDGQAVTWNSLYWIATGGSDDELVYSDNATVWLAISSTKPGTAITSRIVSSNLYPVPYINIRHLGALGDGITSDKKVIDAAIAIANNYPNGVTITVPSGRYRYEGSDTLDIPSNINLVLEYGASIVNSGGNPLEIRFDFPETGNNVFETRNGEDSRISRYDGRSITGSFVHGTPYGRFGSSDGVDSTMHDITYDNAFVSTISTEIFINGIDAATDEFIIVDPRTFRKNQALKFDDTFADNVALNTVYYIHTAVSNGTRFKITDSPDGAVIPLTGNETGTFQLYEGDGTLRGLNVRDVMNNPSKFAGGNRTVINGRFQQEESTSSGASGSRYVGVAGSSTTISGDSGTGLAKANTRGSYIGGNFYASATGPASINIATVTGVETNVEVGGSSTSRHIVGVASVGSVNAGARGSASANAAYTVGGAIGPRGQNHSGWTTGILFTNLHGEDPMNSSGTLIGSYWDSGSATRTITDGIDLSGFVMSNNVLKSRTVTIKDTDSSISISPISGTTGTTKLDGKTLTLGSDATTGNSLIKTASNGTTLQLQGSTTSTGGVEILDQIGTSRLTVNGSDNGAVVVKPANGIVGTTTLSGTQITIQNVASNTGTTKLTNNGLELGSTSNESTIRSVAGTSLVIRPHTSGSVRVTNAAGNADRIITSDTNVTVTGGNVAEAVTLNTSSSAGTIVLQNNSTTIATVSSTGLVTTGLTASGIVSLAASTAQNITGINTGTAGINTAGLTATGIVSLGAATSQNITGINTGTAGITGTGIVSLGSVGSQNITGINTGTAGINTTGLTATSIVSLGVSTAQNITGINTGTAGINTTELTATGIFTTGLTATNIFTTGLTASNVISLRPTASGLNISDIRVQNLSVDGTLTCPSFSPDLSSGISTAGVTATGIVSLRTSGQNITGINTGEAGISTYGLTATSISMIKSQPLKAIQNGKPEFNTSNIIFTAASGVTFPNGTYSVGQITALGGTTGAFAQYSFSGTKSATVASNALTIPYSELNLRGATITINAATNQIVKNCSFKPGVNTVRLPSSISLSAGTISDSTYGINIPTSTKISFIDPSKKFIRTDKPVLSLTSATVEAGTIMTGVNIRRGDGLYEIRKCTLIAGSDIIYLGDPLQYLVSNGSSAGEIGSTPGIQANSNLFAASYIFAITSSTLTATTADTFSISGLSVTSGVGTTTDMAIEFPVVSSATIAAPFLPLGIDTGGLTASGGIHTTGLTATGIVSLGASTAQNITGINTGTAGLTAGGIVSLGASTAQNITGINTGDAGINTLGLTAANIWIRNVGGVKAIQDGKPSTVVDNIVFTAASGVTFPVGNYLVGPLTALGGTTGAFAQYSFSGTKSATATSNALTIPFSDVPLRGGTITTSGPQTIRNCRLVAGETIITVPSAITLNNGTTNGGIFSFNISISAKIASSVAGVSVTLDTAVGGTGLAAGTGTIIAVPSVLVGSTTVADCILIAGSPIIYSNNIPNTLVNGTSMSSQVFTVTLASTSLTGSATPTTTFTIGAPITSSPSGSSIIFPIVSSATIAAPFIPTGINTGGLTASGIVSLGASTAQNITGINTGTAGITAGGIVSLGSATAQNITGINTGTAGITVGGTVTLGSVASQNITGINTGTAGITAGGIVSLRASTAQNITGINTGTAGITAGGIVSLRTSGQNITAIHTGTNIITTGGLDIQIGNDFTGAVENGRMSGTSLIMSVPSGISLINGSYNVGPFTATAGTTGAFSPFSFSETNRPVTITNNNTITIPSYPANAPKGATLSTTRISDSTSQTITNCRLAAGSTVTVPFPITLNTANVGTASYTFQIASGKAVVSVAADRNSFTMVDGTISYSSNIENGTILSNVLVTLTSGASTTTISPCTLIAGSNVIYQNNLPGGFGNLSGYTSNAHTYTVTVPPTTLTGGTLQTSFNLASAITVVPTGPIIEFPVISAGTLGGTLNSVTSVSLDTSGLQTSGLTATGIVSLGSSTAQNITGINTGTAGITTSGITGGSGALNINSTSNQNLSIVAPGSGQLILGGGNANSVVLKSGSDDIVTVTQTELIIKNSTNIISQLIPIGHLVFVFNTGGGEIMTKHLFTHTGASLTRDEDVITYRSGLTADRITMAPKTRITLYTEVSGGGTAYVFNNNASKWDTIIVTLPVIIDYPTIRSYKAEFIA